MVLECSPTSVGRSVDAAARRRTCSEPFIPIASPKAHGCRRCQRCRGALDPNRTRAQPLRVGVEANRGAVCL